jgi:NADH-quinone oxidoreductase subunit J
MMLFYLFGAVAVAASLLVITQRNPIYSVLLLIASFGALSGLYVLLDAPFVAVIQIIVYAGAIMVLFLFVVMLLNAPAEKIEERRLIGHGPMGLGSLLAALLAIELVWALTSAGGESGDFPGASVSSVTEIGRLLFTTYAFQFEVTSVLILVAIVAAVQLAGRRSPQDPRELGPGAPESTAAPREE